MLGKVNSGENSVEVRLSLTQYYSGRIIDSDRMRLSFLGNDKKGLGKSKKEN